MLVGNTALEKFEEEGNITRANPEGVLKDLFGSEIVLFKDGEEHRVRKRTLLILVTRDRLEELIPDCVKSVVEPLNDCLLFGSNLNQSIGINHLISFGSVTSFEVEQKNHVLE